MCKSHCEFSHHPPQTGSLCVCMPGTERARGISQTLLNVPYGEGQREKLDVYVPTSPSLGRVPAAFVRVCVRVRVSDPSPQEYQVLAFSL